VAVVEAGDGGDLCSHLAVGGLNLHAVVCHGADDGLLGLDLCQRVVALFRGKRIAGVERLNARCQQRHGDNRDQQQGYSEF